MTAGDASVVLAVGLAVMDMFAFAGYHFCSFYYVYGQDLQD